MYLAPGRTDIPDITATVKRGTLPVTVTERGELESSLTVDARCEVEGYQNKIVTILPEGTAVKGPRKENAMIVADFVGTVPLCPQAYFTKPAILHSWVKEGDLVVTFDVDQLKKAHDDQEVKWKQADGKAKMAVGELEVVRNKAEGDIAEAELAFKLAEIDRDKYLDGEFKVEDAKK